MHEPALLPLKSMTATAITQTTDKTNRWLNELADELNWDEPDMTFKALRAVLQQLRDRLPVNESAQLASQLPMLIRGAYYENWDPVEGRASVDAETFVNRVATAFPNDLTIDPREVTVAVFRVLASHVTPGEIEDVRACLPNDFQELWPPS